MPAQSEAQRRFIYGNKGAAFAKAHHFDNAGKLPERVGKKHGRAKLIEEASKK